MRTKKMIRKILEMLELRKIEKYRERCPHMVSDTLVRFYGKTDIGTKNILFRARVPGEENFVITKIHFLINIENRYLLSDILASMFFIIMVGNKPMVGGSVATAYNRPLIFDKSIKIERFQHFSVFVDFRDINIPQYNTDSGRDFRETLFDLSLPKVLPTNPGEEIVKQFNDDEGLKSIECCLGGVVERVMA